MALATEVAMEKLLPLIVDGITQYCVDAVIPVGSAPVVVKTTGHASNRGAVPLNGCEVHVTTAGEAMVTVIVAVVDGPGHCALINSPMLPAAALLFVATPACPT